MIANIFNLFRLAIKFQHRFPFKSLQVDPVQYRDGGNGVIIIFERGSLAE